MKIQIKLSINSGNVVIALFFTVYHFIVLLQKKTNDNNNLTICYLPMTKQHADYELVHLTSQMYFPQESAES